MKRNFLYACLIALASVGFTACESDENGEYGDEKIPEGALPSEEFTPGNFEAEPYAEDAIKIEVQSTLEGNPEFSSIELFGDGHYLMSGANNNHAPQKTVKAKREADGSVSVFKKRGTKRMATRANEDGTIIFDNGSYTYGTYTREQKGVYRFNNGALLDLRKLQEGSSEVVYTNSDGSKSTVYVNYNVDEKPLEMRSICRSWRMNSFETWHYFNGAYIAHGKQWITNCVVSHNVEFSSAAGKWDYDKDDVLDEDSEFCKRVIFSSSTYLCFYVDGTAEVSGWDWRDRSNGTLYYYDLFDQDNTDKWDGYVTVRFKGSQMRVYEDYSDSEDGMSFRMICVNTLTAGY